MVSVVCSLWRLWRPDGVSVLESWQAARADQLAGSFPEVLGLRSRWGPKDYSPHHWVGAGPGGSAKRGHRVGLCLMDNSSIGQVLLGGSWGGVPQTQRYRPLPLPPQPYTCQPGLPPHPLGLWAEAAYVLLGLRLPSKTGCGLDPKWDQPGRVRRDEAQDTCLWFVLRLWPQVS